MSNAEIIPAGQTAIIDEKPAAGTIQRQEFGAQEIQVSAETASTAAAASVKAEIEAAYVMAMQRPRNLDTVYGAIMRDCKRPSFAEKAMYRLKRGGKEISDVSIRFVEAALRAMGNVTIRSQVVYDDAEKQLVHVIAVDLETNTRFEDSAIIEKKVERSSPREGLRNYGTRRNSDGRLTYIVEPTMDELRQMRGAEISRLKRNLGKELLPFDFVEDAKVQINRTLTDRAKKDPDAERKSIIMAFSDLNVTADSLALYLGHPIEQCQPSELVALRQLWSALSEGRMTWTEVMADKASELAAKEAAKPDDKKNAADKLKARVAPQKEAPAAGNDLGLS